MPSALLLQPRARRASRFVAGVAVALAVIAVRADNTAQSLPFSQAWTNTSLITADDNWSGVPGITGYRGDDLTTSTGTDPQTIVVDGTGVVDVIANQTNTAITNGGVAEFQLANPTIALNGSGTADAPFILISVATTGNQAISVSYNLRDIDGTTDNAIQPVALQFRVGTTGNFTNVPAGFVADATTGPSLATLVTPVSATLPAAADNQAVVQLRIMTTNAVGNDEWVGIDDISITGTPVSGPVPPTMTVTATPQTVDTGSSTLLKATVTPGANPASTGLSVTANLSAIGGSATAPLFDNGTNGDQVSGDNIFSLSTTVTATAGVKTVSFLATDAEARSATAQLDLTVTIPIVATTISAIQGAGAESPILGNTVITRGIVTGIRTNGFFIQSTAADVDGNTMTSEGLFVFTSSAPPAPAVIGNYVQVTGTVSEFGSSSAPPGSFKATQLVSPTVTPLGSGFALPAPVTLTAAGFATLGGLEPYEGMRVEVNQLVVVAPTDGGPNSAAGTSEANATATSTGVFFGVLPDYARPFREAGIDAFAPLPAGAPVTVTRFDTNPERLRVDDGLVGGTPIDVSTGALVTNLVGILDNSFSNYTLLVDPSVTPGVSPGAGVSSVPAARPEEVTVGALNFERFYDTVNAPSPIGDVVLTPTAYQNRLNKASLTIRNVLRTPDILAVVEMENLATLQDLAAKVSADAIAASQVDPLYQAYLVQGNDIGGINVGFLVKTAVAVTSVQQFGKDTVFALDGSLLNDRPPLELRATVTPATGSPLALTVIVNHLRSLNGIDDPGSAGARVRAKRLAQAEFLANHVQGLQVANPAERIVLVGDFNAFEVSDGYVDVIGSIVGSPAPASEVVLAGADLVNPNLVNLVTFVPPSNRYWYSFDGNAQVLDHALVTQNLVNYVSRVSFSRSNADQPETQRNDPNTPARLTDHDGVVVAFAMGAPRLVGQVVAKTAGAATIDVRFTNSGTGNVIDGRVEGITFRTMAGIGTVTLAGPALPISLGVIAPGQSVVRTLQLNVPAGVTRFTVTETGSLKSAAGDALRFSSTQTVIK